MEAALLNPEHDAPLVLHRQWQDENSDTANPFNLDDYERSHFSDAEQGHHKAPTASTVLYPDPYRSPPAPPQSPCCSAQPYAHASLAASTPRIADPTAVQCGYGCSFPPPTHWLHIGAFPVPHAAAAARYCCAATPGSSLPLFTTPGAPPHQTSPGPLLLRTPPPQSARHQFLPPPYSAVPLHQQQRLSNAGTPPLVHRFRQPQAPLSGLPPPPPPTPPSALPQPPKVRPPLMSSPLLHPSPWQSPPQPASVSQAPISLAAELGLRPCGQQSRRAVVRVGEWLRGCRADMQPALCREWWNGPPNDNGAYAFGACGKVDREQTLMSGVTSGRKPVPLSNSPGCDGHVIAISGTRCTCGLTHSDNCKEAGHPYRKVFKYLLASSSQPEGVAGEFHNFPLTKRDPKQFVRLFVPEQPIAVLWHVKATVHAAIGTCLEPGKGAGDQPQRGMETKQHGRAGDAGDASGGGSATGTGVPSAGDLTVHSPSTNRNIISGARHQRGAEGGRSGGKDECGAPTAKRRCSCLRGRGGGVFDC